MIFQLQNLNRSTFQFLPDECQSCGWWQDYAGGWPSESERDDWCRRAEELFGGWGKLAMADEQLLGMIQYGPPDIFPGMKRMSCGSASGEALLITCNTVLDESFAAARKSLILAALAEFSELEVESAEAYCPRKQDDPPGMSHLFPRDFLVGLGFYATRSSGDFQLMRMELGGLDRPTARSRRSRGKLGLLDRIRHPAPSPSPATLCGRNGARGRQAVPGACG